MYRFAISLVSVLFSLLLFGKISAQEITEKGFLVGLNAAQLTSHPVEIKRTNVKKDLLREIGVTLGFYFKFKLGETRGLRAEVLYSKEGAGHETRRTFTEPERTQTESSDFTFHYLRIPVLLTFDVDAHGEVAVGGYFGGAEWKEEYRVVRTDTTTRVFRNTFGDTFAPFPEIGIIVSGSYRIGNIQLSARYLRGNSMPISHSSQALQEYLSGLHEVQFVVGYAF